MTKLLLEMKEAFTQSGRTIKQKQPLTDVFPKGVTIMYGRSGAGKTVSTIKHLARNGLDVILLDFDENPPINEVDYLHFDGRWFFEYLKNIETPTKKLDMFCINNFKAKDKYGNDVPELAKKRTNIFKERCLPLLSEEKQKEFKELEDGYNMEEPIRYNNEVFIIDTYHKFVSIYGEDEIKKSCAELTRKGANVVIISHETGERGKETGIDEAFVNHCNGRMRLHHDITKTKNDVYLIVEKNRSLIGDNKIDDWERE